MSLTSHGRPLAALTALALAALPIAGCGTEASGPPSGTGASTAATTSIPSTDTTLTLPATASSTATAPGAGTAPTGTSTATTPPGDEQDAVRTVIVRYVGAFANADGATACALLTQESQQAFLNEVKDLSDATTCADAFSQVTGQVPESERVDFGRSEVTDVRVSGDSAVATLSLQGVANTVLLSRTGGRWLIANLPGS